MSKKLYFLVPNNYNSLFYTGNPSSEQLDDVNKLFDGTGDVATTTTSGDVDIDMLYSSAVSGEVAFLHNNSVSVVLTGDNFTVDSTLTGSDGILWELDPISPTVVDYSCTLTGSIVEGDTFQGFTFAQKIELPMFDDGYTIEYSFPDAGEFKGALKTFVDYNYINNNQLSVIYKYKWSGLIEAEKDEFISFINNFKNSFQPFYILNLNADNDSFTTQLVMIENNSVVLNKDSADLYSVEMNLIDMSVVFLVEDDAPVPDYGDGWGIAWNVDYGAPTAWVPPATETPSI